MVICKQHISFRLEETQQLSVLLKYLEKKNASSGNQTSLNFQLDKWKKMKARDIQKQFQMPWLPGAQEENMQQLIGSAASPVHASYSGIRALCTSLVKNLKLSPISHTWTALK